MEHTFTLNPYTVACMKQFYLTLILFLSFTVSLYAQNLNIQTTVPSGLTVCGQADTFAVSLTNTSSDTLENVSVSIRLPIGIHYVLGSLTGAATAVDVSQLDSIVLSISDMPPADVVSFTILTEALCEATSNASLLDNIVEVCFDGGCESHTSANYNVDVGSLVISSYSQQNYTGDIGDVFERCLTIRNSGLGTITNFDWLYRYDPNMLTIDSLRLFGGGLLNPSISNDSIWLNIDGSILSSIGDGDTLFDSGEEIQLCYRVSIDDCSNSNLPDTTRVFYGCNGSICSMAERVGNVAVVNGIPLLTATPVTFSNVCFSDPAGHLTYIIFSNTGSGPARDVSIDLFQATSGSFSSAFISRIDETQLYWKSSNGTTDTLTPTTLSYNQTGGVYDCLGPNPVGRVVLDIPSIGVGEVDTLVIRQYACCVQQCATDIGLGMRFNYSYSDVCQENVFSVPTSQARNYLSQRILAINYDGPTDVNDGDTFDFAFVHSSHSSFPQGPNSRSEIELVFPPGLSFSGGVGDIQWVYSNGTMKLPTSYTYSGDTLRAFFNGALTGEKAEFRLSLDVNCAGTSNGAVNVEYKLYNITDTSCTCKHLRACSNFTVSLHCPGQPCLDGGMVPLSFEAMRTNYGLPDNDNNGLPDASGTLDMNEVRSNYVCFGDTLQAALTGVVATTGANPFWEYGYADLTISRGDRFVALDAHVRIVDVSTGIEYMCSLAAPSRSNSGSNSTFGYDFSVSNLSGCLPGGFQYESGDSIQLFTHYTFVSNANSGFSSEPITGNFYLTNAANGTPYYCDTYTASYVLVGYYFTTYQSTNVPLNGCGTITTSHSYYLSIGNCCSNYAGGNMFRNEYRAWGWPDTFEIVKPDGYNWVQGDINFVRTAGTGSSFGYSYTPLTPLDPTADTLIFDIKSYFAPYGGTWEISDDGFYGTVRVEWEPSCQVENQVLEPVEYIWNYETVPQLDQPSAYTTRLSQNDYIIYAGPELQFNGAQVANGLTSTVDWDITLTNLSNESEAGNVWVMPVSAGGLNILSIQDATGDTLIPFNGVYQLGDFASGGGNRTITITASYPSCASDSLMLYAGWNCEGYPMDMASYPCPMDSIRLYMIPEESQLQPQLVAPVGTQVDMCDSIPFDLTLTSTLLASVKDIEIDVVLPASGGLSLVPDSSQLRYPFNDAGVLIADPTLVSNVYTWKIDSISAYLEANGLQGSLATGDSNALSIRFLMRTDCDFISGSNFFVRIRSNRVCGDVMPTLFRASPAIDINGVTIAYQTNVTIIPPDSINGCGSEPFTMRIVNLGPSATVATDQIQCILPEGVEYAGNLQGSVNPPSGNPSQQALGNNTLLTWAMPAGVGAGDTILYSFDVNAIPTTTCTSVSVSAQTVAEVSLSCHGTVCPSAVTQTGATDGTIEIAFPTLSLDVTQSDWTATGGGNADLGYSATLNHIGGAALNAGESIEVVLYADVDASGTVNGVDTQLGTYTVSSLSIGETLAFGDTIAIDTNDFGQNDILLVAVNQVGVGASCVCSEVNDTISPDVLCREINLVCPSNISVSADPSACGQNVTVPLPQIENCPYVSYTNDYNGVIDASDFYAVGTHTVTWSAENGLGITDQCSITIDVVDDTNPSISCPASITQSTDAGNCTAAVTVGAASASDNCTVASIVNDFNNTSAASDTYSLGVTTITWSATDGSGNTSTCSMSISIEDNELPTITCPSSITQSADVGSCDAAVTVGAVTASDNCTGATVVSDFNGMSDASGTYPVGVTPVVWTITDGSGNSATCSITVTIEDNGLPTISCPSDITQDTDIGVCNANVSMPTPTGGDNCASAAFSNDFNGTSNASDVYPLGTTSILWTATDGGGNTATCSMTVTIEDNEIPTLICPADITQTTDASGCDAAVTVPPGVGTDNCALSNYVNYYTGTTNASGTYPLGTTNVTWFARDVSGNTASCAMAVTIQDGEAPSITCPSGMTQTADAGNCSAAMTVGMPSGSDNCTLAGFTNDFTGNSDASGTYPVGNTTVVWTASDAAGNTATCSIVITIEDNESPTISCPVDITQVMDANSCDAAVTVGAASGTDNCAIMGYVNDFTGTSDASSTYPIGNTTVIWTASDAAGNTATCSMAVTIEDAESPMIMCPSDITQTADAGNCDAAVTVGAASGTDNCGVSMISNDFTGTSDASDTYPVGMTTVVWTASDAAGNTATCSSTVTIEDDENPTITCPADMTETTDIGNCTAMVNVSTPTATDNCSSLSFTNTFNATSDASGTYPLGGTTFVWTVTDGAGNFATCSMVVTVQDGEAPVLSCPTDITQSTDAGGCDAAVMIATATATDNCSVLGISNDMTGTSDASGTYPVGSTTVVWTANDAAGNTGTCSMTVTIEDGDAPAVSCPADITQTAGVGNCDASVMISSATATDNCGVASIINDFTGTSDASATYPVGSTTIVWTATDAGGNTATCSMDVTVDDNESPTISCPTDITQSTDAGNCTALVSVNTATAVDNCTGLSFTNDLTGTSDASSSYPLGTTTVVWTVTDGGGNTATCSMSITIEDEEVPVMTCPADVTQNIDPGGCEANVTVTTASGVDNCSSVGISNDFTGTSDASGLYPAGQTQVVWTGTDASGNMGTCSMTIHVIDDEAPAIACRGGFTVPTDPGSCDANVAVGNVDVTDNCAVTNLANDFTGTSDASGTYPMGVTTVVWSAQDGAGNLSSCSMQITVEDNEAPTINCAADMTVSANSIDCDSAMVTVVASSANDNCGVTSLSNDYTGTSDASAMYPIGTTTVVWTASDASANTASCSLDVTVMPLQVMMPNDTSICGGSNIDLMGSAMGGSGSFSYTWLDGSTVIGNMASINVSPDSITTYTLRVDDGQCVDSASVTVTVESYMTNPALCTECWAGVFEYAPLGTTTAAPMACGGTNWTHYYDPANPSALLFSIEHYPAVPGGNTNAFTAEIEITATADPQDSVIWNNSTIWAAEDSQNRELCLIMGRYWNVNIVGGSLNGTVNVRFYYKPEELATIMNLADRWKTDHDGPSQDLYISDPIWFKTQNTQFVPTVDSSNPYMGSITPVGVDDHIVLSAAGYGNANNRNYVQFDGISSFSGGTAAIRVSTFTPVLPLELLQFDARATQDAVLLNWLGIESPDLESYEVQRSTQGNDFVPLGTVEAIGQEGIAQSYGFLDEYPYLGLNSYRLKGYFADGSTEYSQVEQAYFGPDASFSVYPNPFNESIFIEWQGVTEDRVELTLYNALGQMVIKKEWLQSGSYAEEIDMSDLPEGLYVYKIWYGRQMTEGSLIRMK